MELHQAAKKSGNSGLNVLSQQQLKGLQSVLLQIFDDVLTICREENLNYILIGGTAIGAMRHQGFIPWDDDMDIAMPRADFEKFCNAVRTRYGDKYTMLHPQDQENYGRIIPKIRLRGTQYRTFLEWDLDECGVFIDIFPIENVPDNGFLRVCHGTVAMFLGFCLACRRMFRGRKVYRDMMGGVSFYVKCAIGFCLSFASIEQWARWTDGWYSLCKNGHSKWVSLPSDERHYFGELNLRKNLCQTTYGMFDGRAIKLPADVDRYLRDIYGDYMQLPPPEKQVRNCYFSFDLGSFDPDTSEYNSSVERDLT